MGFVKPFCRGGAEPCPYNLPRKKVISIKISTAPSIDGNCSEATSCKSGVPYQAARSTIPVGCVSSGTTPEN